ncbi:MAG TPA: hypothetical protein VLZ33_05415 [Dysgonamonadaceae bacterium]|nr:hypothetical protein [Dysgonamonadaceae bacterium]
MIPKRGGFISVSDDNREFKEIDRTQNNISAEKPGTLFQNFVWQGSIDARYIRYHAISNATKGGCMFVDEVVI